MDCGSLSGERLQLLKSAKRPSSLTFLLVGLVLLVTTAGVFAAFVPIARCGACEIDIAIRRGIPRAACPHTCAHCDGKGQVPLLTHWLRCPEHNP